VILVAGGTGRLGTLLVNRLINRNLPVRVLTRQPTRAEHLPGDLVTIVSGDVRDPETLAPATAGVDVVVSAVHGFTDPHRNSLAAVDRDGNANLIEAAKSAGADLVLMSTVGAAADSPMELFRMKHAAEQDAAASGIPTTIVRATAFLELWIDLMNQTAGRSGRPLVFGRGQNPINFVAVADVAAAVDQAVIDPTTRGKTLEIGGPDNLTFDQLAQAVQTAAGRPRTPRHVPPFMLRLMANSIGHLKPELGRQARAALAMDRTDLTFDPTRLHQLYPDLPRTALADVLARNGTEHTA
jgi:NADH dehydrogenase